MTKEEFITKVTNLKPEESFSICINELFTIFGYKSRRRTNPQKVLTELERMEISCNNQSLVRDWFRAPIELTKKKRLMSACQNHILVVGDIESARKMPTCVKETDSLDTALTLMQKNNYSQLPVLCGNKKNEISGIISWESIGIGLVNKCLSNNVKGFMSKQYKQINNSVRLMDVVELVYDNEFVLVTNANNALCGILTTYDLSIKFKEWGLPFILVGEVEKTLRLILSNVYVDDAEKPYLGRSRDVHSLDDMSFGECINLLDDEIRWTKLGLNRVDRSEFVNMLKEIKTIRNKTAHYAIVDETRNINEEIDKLKSCVKFLHNICKYRIQKQ